MPARPGHQDASRRVGGRDCATATQLLLDDPPDLVIFTTGLGVRGWLEAADAIQLGDDLHALLGEAELLARGPKANGALVTVGFDVAWTAPRARYDDITDLLSTRDLRGVRIAVQLDGAGADGSVRRRSKRWVPTSSASRCIAGRCRPTRPMPSG